MGGKINFYNVVLNYDPKLNTIYNTIRINLKQLGFGINCLAMWDTGSFYSLFTDNLVNKYDLKSDNLINVKQAGYKIKKNYLYNVDLYITDNIVFKDLKVSHIDILHYDFIIGMDIIKLGNFKLINVGDHKEYIFYYPR